MSWIEISFWISFIIIVYAFLGYGLVLYTMVKIKRFIKPGHAIFDANFEPYVTLIIPCFNEAEILREKIANCLQLNYPATKLSILFITDGSSDNSNAILEDYPQIEVLHQNNRFGKSAAENRAMKFVKTPYVIFSDANTMINSEAVKNIVKHFKNATVGCVSGEKRIISEVADTASAAGEGIYWKYESLLKRWDAELNSAVGAAGELVAFRSSLYIDLPEDTILDDFMQSMQIAAKGYKIVYEPQAYALETASVNIGEEFKRKVRICAGGWQAIIRLINKIHIEKTPLLFFQYVSHRVLRWTITPFLLISMFILNFMLAFDHQPLYQIIIAIQIAFYSAAIIGFVLENKKIRLKPVFVPYYFCMMNYAVIAGLLKFVSGKQKATWDKAQRKTAVIN